MELGQSELVSARFPHTPKFANKGSARQSNKKQGGGSINNMNNMNIEGVKRVKCKNNSCKNNSCKNNSWKERERGRE